MAAEDTAPAGPSLVCPCGSPDVDIRSGLLCPECTAAVTEEAGTAAADRAAAELARLHKLLAAARRYRVLVDEDGDLQLLGPCAETIGCLFHRCFTSEDGASLGALIDVALEHEGEQGKQAHAYLAKIGGREVQVKSSGEERADRG